MLRLCIGELVEIVGGTLTFGSLPPLAGTFEPVRRVVVDSREVKPGDVYWGLVGEHYDGGRRAEDALLKGALGVVIAGRHIEPWAGRFSLRVADANAAFMELAKTRPVRLRKKHRPHWHSGTTQMVLSMLAGQPVRLQILIERLARHSDHRTQTEQGVDWQLDNLLEAPPTVS